MSMNYSDNLVIISLFAVVVRTIIGLLSMAWAPITVLRIGTYKRTNCELVVRFIVNIFWIGFRVVSLAMLASYSVFWLFFVCVVHVLLMLGWINVELNPENPEKLEWTAMTVLAALYVMYYITFSEEPEVPAVFFSLFYVIIVSYENMCCMAYFFVGSISDIILPIVICGVVVGMMTCLKFFSLDKNWPCKVPYL